MKGRGEEGGVGGKRGREMKDRMEERSGEWRETERWKKEEE